MFDRIPTKTLVKIAAGAAFVYIVLGVAYYYFILDREGRPYCHKQFYLAFKTWMDDRSTNAFPNTVGRSADSLAEIQEEMGGSTNWAAHYRYVPGLYEDDPGDLILMYFDSPTRWKWHGPSPTIFQEKAWIIVPADFTQSSRRVSHSGELNEWVPTQEFCNRLQRTIDFVRTNQRPNWGTVVAEHTEFLDSIKRGVR
jgi:hypothetical protein